MASSISKYWVNESGKKVFCLAHAPNAEAAEQVHREAHGMMAEKIIEVEPDVAEVFLGGMETDPAGAVLLPGGGADRDPGIRTILFTDVVNSTTLTQSLGDEAALALLGVHDTIVRDALAASRRSRNKAHWRRYHGVIRLTSGRSSLCNSDPTRIEQACASKSRSIRSRSGLARQPANPSSNTTISLDRQFNSLPASAPTRNRSKSLSRTQSPSCASAKHSRFEDVGEVTLKGFNSPVRAHAAAWQ